jgi:hypothetical protein
MMKPIRSTFEQSFHDPSDKRIKLARQSPRQTGAAARAGNARCVGQAMTLVTERLTVPGGKP